MRKTIKNLDYIYIYLYNGMYKISENSGLWTFKGGIKQ